jgi:hypothetical protein
MSPETKSRTTSLLASQGYELDSTTARNSFFVHAAYQRASRW